jgi:phosphoribosylglycinamide formyltransferase-1
MKQATSRIHIAILGSGKGSNAHAIINAAKTNDVAYEVSVIITTRPDSGIAEVGRGQGIPVEVLSADTAENGDQITRIADDYSIELLVLSGFMRMLPTSVIQHLHGQVINIHPALLPAYGGKGMYGRKVHQAVLNAGETVTGVTIHWVTEEYDAGAIIVQETIDILGLRTAEEIEGRVKSVEHSLYPRVINEMALRLEESKN